MYDDLNSRVARRSEAKGSSDHQFGQEPWEESAEKGDPHEDAKEWERLSQLVQGISRGWKFNREELHER